MAFMEEISAVEAFEALPRAQRSLVFYSEGPTYWPYFRPIIEALLLTYKYPLVYLSSSKDDPGLAVNSILIKTFYIGSGGPRQNLFSNLDADVVVMTMPDLDNLSIARSAKCKNYVYVFHSPVSTHMVYLEGAFDHYDTVFCVGPHHEEEIRKRESALALEKKQLFAHGYGRLDEIISSAPEHADHKMHEKVKILIAPSWGPDGIFETIGGALIGELLEAGFEVIARPHPQTMRLSGKTVSGWAGQFENHKNFMLETDMSEKQSFYKADVMISDWSGASFDFAFGLLKPVIFIDTPRKVRNPAYGELNCEPLEASIRNRISEIIDPEDIHMLPEIIRNMIHAKEEKTENIMRERDRWIYNIGRSGEVGAAKLMQLAVRHVSHEQADEPQLEKHIRCTVNTMLNDCANEQNETEDGNPVSFLKRLMSCSSPYIENDISALEALCRSVDVLKKLRQTYDANFHKGRGNEMLDVNAYPALTYAYVEAASQVAQSDRGRALKFMNTAGKVLAMYLTAGGVMAAPLLESLMCQRYEKLGVSVA